MQTADKKRRQKMITEQQIKPKESIDLPQNRFLNEKDDKGEIKYPIATKLRKYFIANPDPIITDMRMANAILHEIRWNLQQSGKYWINYQGKEAVTMRDKQGRIMEKDDCYLAHISSKQNIHIALSKLREHLSNRLLSKCEADFFTFDQYNEFVGKIDKIVTELGYELFPDEVKLIEPL